MKEKLIKELRTVQAYIISAAIEYLHAAERNSSDIEDCKDYYIYEGMIKAVSQVQERIEEIKKEEE